MKYQIAQCEIDTRLFQVTASGSQIAVEPKVFDLLVYLIENRGQVVSREQLFQQIWAGREVSDTTLSNHIKSVRKLLGDNGEQQQVIKTIRGRGYQLVADVVRCGHEETLESQSPIAKGKVLKQTALHTSKLVSLGLGLLFIISCAWWLIPAEQPAKNLAKRPYILVVPFSVSGNDDDKWQAFADQITREVIVKLRKISGLKVLPASSAFIFKQNKSTSHVREKLPEVDYLLDADIKIDDFDNMQINVELTKLNSNKLVWDEHYRSRVDNTKFFKIQGQIAESASKSLKVAIMAKEYSALNELPTANLAAYERFVEGQKQLNLLTNTSLQKAVSLFSQAIQLDPQFEAAYVAKADAYRIIMSYFQKPSDVFPNVVDSVLDALSINENSAPALSSLGLAYVLAWRWQDAFEVLSAARIADPSLAQTELGFALYYAGIGNIDGVYRSLENANQLDPLNIELADWGHWALAMVGENDAAIKWAKDKIQLHPDVGLLYSGASVSASLAGEHERAIALAKKGVYLDSGAPYAILALAQSYGHAKQLSEIPPLLTQAQQMEGFLCPYETAITYLLIDQTTKAFELFNDAVNYRSNCLVFTRNDPRLAPIRRDPRFLALLTRIGLDDNAIRQYPRN